MVIMIYIGPGHSYNFFLVQQFIEKSSLSPLRDGLTDSLVLYLSEIAPSSYTSRMELRCSSMKSRGFFWPKNPLTVRQQTPLFCNMTSNVATQLYPSGQGGTKKTRLKIEKTLTTSARTHYNRSKSLRGRGCKKCSHEGAEQ